MSSVGALLTSFVDGVRLTIVLSRNDEETTFSVVEVSG